MAIAAQAPDIQGERQYGQDVRTQNGAISLRLFMSFFVFCTLPCNLRGSEASIRIVLSLMRKRANDLVRNKIHPTSIIGGYRIALREARRYVNEKLAVRVESLEKDSLINCAKASMSSKLISGERDFFANLVVDAVQAVRDNKCTRGNQIPNQGN
ncbi:hypothetical protein SLE2022_177840 [Rubroshorea leprosula]